MGGRDAPNQPDSLLAAMIPYRGEVGLTTVLWWILGLEGGNDALDSLVRRTGVVPEPDGNWLTEVIGKDRSRTDLEYHWGKPAVAQVIVEAKIGHTLHHSQLAAYRERLPDDGGLLVVLAPEVRRHEGDAVVDAYRAEYPEDPVRLDVWSFDDVAACLADHLPDSSDVAQFKGLVEAYGALDIPPFSDSELLDNNPTRLTDILGIFDRATFGLFDRWLPSGRDRYFQYRRYIALDPYPYLISVGVGLLPGDPAPGPRPWVWLRVADEPACGPTAQGVLDELHPGETVRDDAGVSIPLYPAAGMPGTEVTKQVRIEVEQIATRIRQALDGLAQAAITTSPRQITDAQAAVRNVLPLDPADLLDSSNARFEDIKRLVLEAAKSVMGEQLGRPSPDRCYARNYWLRVEPFETYVAVAFGRKDQLAGNGAQPWAWLRVHGATPYAEIAFGVMSDLYPGRLADDVDGLAVPIEVPVGVTGPEMVQGVHHQLHAVMTAIRRAILAAYGSHLHEPSRPPEERRVTR